MRFTISVNENWEWTTRWKVPGNIFLSIIDCCSVPSNREYEWRLLWHDSYHYSDEYKSCFMNNEPAKKSINRIGVWTRLINPLPTITTNISKKKKKSIIMLFRIHSYQAHYYTGFRLEPQTRMHDILLVYCTNAFVYIWKRLHWSPAVIYVMLLQLWNLYLHDSCRKYFCHIYRRVCNNNNKRKTSNLKSVQLNFKQNIWNRTNRPFPN